MPDHPYHAPRTTFVSSACVRCGMSKESHGDPGLVVESVTVAPQTFAHSRVYLNIGIKAAMSPTQILERVRDALDLIPEFESKTVSIQRSNKITASGKTLDRYQISCECGSTFEARTTEGACPECRRKFRVSWQIAPPPVEQPKTITED